MKNTLSDFKDKFSEIITNMENIKKADKSLELSKIDGKITEIMNILKEISK